MAPRLTRGPIGRNGSAPAISDTSHSRLLEALHRSTRGITKIVAARCRVGESYVYKMVEGEAPSYFQQAHRWIFQALQDLPERDALAPLAWLVEQVGYRLERVHDGSTDLLGALAREAREAGEARAVILDGLADGRLTTEESRTALAEAEDALATWSRIVASLRMTGEPAEERREQGAAA